MKSFLIFAAGIVVGALAIGSGIAQPGRGSAEAARDGALAQTGSVDERPQRALNHIGLVVADYAAAYAFYTENFGFKAAYTVEQADGSPLLTYLQLDRDTFVELIPARANQAAGITHFGVEVADIDAAVARLREHGMTVADPGLTPANARYVRVRDADGNEIEVMEFGPESLQRRAMDAWR